MENKLIVVQTEIMFEVDYNDQSYSAIFTEDKNLQSGFTSWEIYNEDGLIYDTSLESEIIAYIIENM